MMTGEIPSWTECASLKELEDEINNWEYIFYRCQDDLIDAEVKLNMLKEAYKKCIEAKT